MTVPSTYDEADGLLSDDGLSSDDVTQNSAVLSTRGVDTGGLTFQIALDPTFSHVVKSKHVSVTAPLVPVKVEFASLKPHQAYYYRSIDSNGMCSTANSKQLLRSRFGHP